MKLLVVIIACSTLGLLSITRAITTPPTLSVVSLGCILPVLLSVIANTLKKNKASRKVNLSWRKERDLIGTLFAANPGFFVAIDTDGKVTLMNEVMLNALGYTLQEVVNRDYISTFILEKDRKSWAKFFWQLREKRQTHRNEHRLLTKEGQTIWVEWRAQAVTNPQTSKLDFLFSAGIEITERKRSEMELRLLPKITKAVSAASDFQSALLLTLGLVAKATDWDLAEAWIPNPQDTHLIHVGSWHQGDERLEKFRQATTDWEMQPQVNLPGRVWLSQQPEWIADVTAAPQHLFARRHLARSCGLRTALAIPIVAEGQVLAILVFFRSESQASDRRLLQIMTSIALQLGSIFASKQAQARYRSIFENSVEGIFQTLLDGCLLNANPALAKLLGYSSALELLKEITDVEQQLYVYPQQRQEFIRLLKSSGMVSEFEAQFYRRDNSTIWVLLSAREVRNVQGRLLYYEGSVVDITERKSHEEQLRYFAYRDTLTGLGNRAWMQDRLQEALRRTKLDSGYKFAFLCFGLDDFKLINDSLGHLAGDRLLVAISWKLRACLRENDSLARLGGDEFAMLLDDIESIEEVISITQKIQRYLSQPLKLIDKEIFAGVSIGIVPSKASSGDSLEVLRDADIAMYRAKAKGKGNYVIFDEKMHCAAVRRLQLETDLRWAIAKEEFQVYYQPIVGLLQRQITGFEALIRWRHPQEGLISPEEFIPIAEESGLITAIGDWVLREACYQLRLWKEQFPHYPDLRMSVNLSSKQLSGDLNQRIGAILDETNLQGKDLKLEITETALMTDVDRALSIFYQLKARQIQLCIDDFGTGYCSLSYLHRLPIDILKIDQSFVRQMAFREENSAIIKTIVNLAHNLGIEVVAEGVESVEQLLQLQGLECQYGQGFFLSEPLSRSNAADLLAVKSLAQAWS